MVVSCRLSRSRTDRHTMPPSELTKFSVPSLLPQHSALAPKTQPMKLSQQRVLFTAPQVPYEAEDKELWIGEEQREADSCQLQGV